MSVQIPKVPKAPKNFDEQFKAILEMTEESRANLYQFLEICENNFEILIYLILNCCAVDKTCFKVMVNKILLIQ